MSIVFDEYQYAESLLKNGFKDFIKWIDLLALARYYRYNGYNSPEIKKAIVSFYKQFNPEYNEVLMGEKIDNAIAKSKKQPLRFSVDVYITQQEMANIRKIKNYKYEKILFVMLVLSRYNKLIYGSRSNRYYINQNFSTILSLAKVYVNKQERNYIKHFLHKAGMITAPEMNKYSEKNTKEIQELLYSNENSNHDIIVNNLLDIVSFYPLYCDTCGNVIENANRNQKMCNNCSEEANKMQTKARVAKYREKVSDNN